LWQVKIKKKHEVFHIYIIALVWRKQKRLKTHLFNLTEVPRFN
jgi:hypothetical protein